LQKKTIQKVEGANNDLNLRIKQSLDEVVMMMMTMTTTTTMIMVVLNISFKIVLYTGVKLGFSH
jgi:hypothetical protein